MEEAIQIDETWVIAEVSTFISSDEFKAPMESFIDYNCVIFSSDADHSPEQYEAFMMFAKVDILLKPYIFAF